MQKEQTLLSSRFLCVSLFLTCVFCQIWPGSSQTDIPGLFLFGERAGDLLGPTGDDAASDPLSLPTPFRFLGSEYDSIIVNSNGVISFDFPFLNCCSRSFSRTSPPLIAPYWHDFNPRIAGSIFYRVTNDVGELQLFQDLYLSLERGEDLPDIVPTYLFIATWDQVPEFNRPANITNTLQVLLATDGIQSVSIFIYHDIQWGASAQIGFNLGDGFVSFAFPEALTPQTIDIDQLSNVGRRGVFAFRIDRAPNLNLSNIFPFGVDAGDTLGPFGDDSSAGPIFLETPFELIGRQYGTIFVNSNGVLSLDAPFTAPFPDRFPISSPPLVAPFWQDFDPTITGNISYRLTNESDPFELQRFQRLYLSLVGIEEASGFTPTLLFIATWDQISEYLGRAEVNNTMQVILATDGTRTVAVFIYRDIQWSGVGGGAEIGFNVGDGYTSFRSPLSLSDETINVDRLSNVGVPGVFVYRIDIEPVLKLSGIFPFGVTAGDRFGPTGDDSSSKAINLAVPFNFLGREYQSIILNTNGVLSFGTAFASCCPPRDFPLFSPPLIAPFWHDIDLSIAGNVSYRQSSDSNLLSTVHILLMSINSRELRTFFPTHLFIVTWNHVPEYAGSITDTNTFQVVLATDTITTVALFIYHELEWGREAQVGFNAGDGLASFSIPGALTFQTISLDGRTNVGEPGVFVYPINSLPDQPSALRVDSSEATSVSLQWNAPFEINLLYPVLYYRIIALNLNSTSAVEAERMRTVRTVNDATFFNITGLLPDTRYELSVLAVYDESQDDTQVAASQVVRSTAVVLKTGITVPALQCASLVSANGAMELTWTYNHTGGLPLTRLSVSYSASDDSGSAISTPSPVTVSSVDDTSVTISTLEAGFKYRFNITAENRNGSSSIQCGPVPHDAGRPSRPVINEISPGPGSGQVTIVVSEPASGLDSTSSDGSEVFLFMVTPILDGIAQESVAHVVPDYQSGTLETIIVSGLEEVESYDFSVTATNRFGQSQEATYAAVMTARSVDAPLIGGVVGGSVVAVLVILLLTVVVVVIALRIRKARHERVDLETLSVNRGDKNSVHVNVTAENLHYSEAVYEELGSLRRPLPPPRPVTVGVKLENCPAYGVHGVDPESSI